MSHPRHPFTFLLSLLLLVVLSASLTAAALAAPTAIYTVNSTADTTDGTCNSAAPGGCTFREAIANSNTSVGVKDLIRFNIPPAGAKSILVGSDLPDINDPVTIDGTTQPGYSGTPIIEIKSDYGVFIGLDVRTNDSLIKGLVINRFRDNGIHITGHGNTIQNNFLGTDIGGTKAFPNGVGIEIDGGSENLIGGTRTTMDCRGVCNLISGNGGGAASGAEGLGAGGGVLIVGFGPPCICPAPPEGSGVGAYNRVQGNFIGTDVTGQQPLGNATFGIQIAGGTNTLVGGTNGTNPSGPCSGDCNIISATLGSFPEISREGFGSSQIIAGGVVIGFGGRLNPQANIEGAVGPSSNNTVQGNFIGTNVTGFHALPNDGEAAVLIFNSSNNLIGGFTAAARNIISGNQADDAVSINAFAVHTLPCPAPPNAEGGACTPPNPAACASPNATPEINSTESASSNRVRMNYIGLAPDGRTALGNTGNGVEVEAEQQTIIVCPAPPNSGATPETSPEHFAFADDNQIISNHIAFNTGNGVEISGDGHELRNRINNNPIHDNALLGIDLAAPSPNEIVTGEGVTPNDPMDPDVGPNELQNFPGLTSATRGATKTTVQGFLNSRPNQTYRIEFYFNRHCDSSGYGEGQRFLGVINVTTGANGRGNFTASFSTLVPVGQFITATATDPMGNTSEFSLCRVVQ